ncbi:hypothetical protein RRX38_02645 [Pseudomonas sp. DTU_2021_1001937_2_SI_NGA_ILE_001]|uniref:hypothetical protein n=1 Tax=Pseudomonas sp. DTU_2021_1001937_2_SI_NGA_ILE_001 TaxID=3077589 RepID=UPI0028FC3164|nr:hypothetical protein [Pseudomonas sp. DTU_2021_1001937_2_SI_NGA_ILE_001]WNW10090.1 hypothetical protein RRX38_02645 [Pseudomonas sp. DTU_2021_1001937_2_SI_NGA_ILE_001]
MNPIAQQALAKARAVLTSAPGAGATRRPVTKRTKTETDQPVYATQAPFHASGPVVYAPPAPPIAVGGHFDRYQVMRGREAAIEFIQQCPAQVIATLGLVDLIRRMEASLANKPASFAHGFNQVLDLLRVEHMKTPALPQAL